MKRSLLTLMLLCACMGCRTPMELNNVQTLTTHPQFPRAAQAAPEFTEAALRTVADLEYQIERRRK
jgi:hypothetical protein